MKNKEIITLIIGIILFILGFFYFRYTNKVEKNRFNDIICSGELKVILLPDSINYFLYNSEIKGYQFEILSKFAEHLKVDLLIINDTLSLLSEDYDIFVKNNDWLIENCKTLRHAINDWYKNFKNTKEYKIIKEKYLKDFSNNFNTGSDFFSVGEGQISIFDNDLKQYGQDFDWRFLSALIFEESRFNPQAQNTSTGAFGIMQVLPLNYSMFSHDTIYDLASVYYVDTCFLIDTVNFIDTCFTKDSIFDYILTYKLETQINAGVRVLARVNEILPPEITNCILRKKLVLCAYNIGYTHVVDALNLSKKYCQSNCNTWNNFSYYLENLANPDYYSDTIVKYGQFKGKFGVDFANKVYYRYLNYKNLVKK